MASRTKKLFKLAPAILMAAILSLPAVVFAAGDVPSIGIFGGIFGDATLAQIIIRLVQLFLALLGLIALIFLIYAGFIWMTAAGDPDKANKAKRMIQQVVIGLVIIFSAFAVTAFIYDRFGPPGGDINPPCVGADCPPTPCVGAGCYPYYYDYNPVIAYVDPAVDVLGNTDFARLLASSTEDDISNGAPGNMISIIGRYFGSAPGKVFFIKRSDNSRVQAQLAPCSRPWSSNLIIATIPDDLDQVDVSADSGVKTADPLRNYNIVVEKSSSDNSTLSSDPWGFQVNKIDRPGICSIDPNHGVYPATTTLSGFKFPVSGTQNIIWNVSPHSVTSNGSGWSPTSAVDVVPRDLAGRALVKIFNGVSNSNSLLFLISAGRQGDPCGYDTQSCREDVTTCVGGDLICQFCSSDPADPKYQDNCDARKNCTCQPPSADICAFNSDPAINAKRACSNGGCDGFEYCSPSGVWSKTCQLTNNACIPFLGNKSGNAAFSWAFSALKTPFPGMRCLSDTWADGTCDLNGCIDPELACDPIATADHDACTCVPKSQLCVAGRVDTATCANIGQCKQVRTCQSSGHWGGCQVTPGCVPYSIIPASTIAAYAWTFNADDSSGDAGPKVVKACDGSIDCSKNRLPSPSPWSDEWNDANHPDLNISNADSCLNAVIYARFTQLMDEATLNTNNIKLFELSGGIWQDATAEYIASIEPQLSRGDAGVDSFMIKLKKLLSPSASFRVYLSKTIRDQTGRNLIDDIDGVNEGLCALGTTSGLPADHGVCWSFNTRPNGPDAICQIGCVNCGPNEYFNRYYGQQRKHAVTPISLDNSCIMLNNQDYAWDWSEQEQGAGGGNWFIQTNVNNAYSWMTDPLAGANGIASQPAHQITAGFGTTTALHESDWRANKDYSSWFGPDDAYYFGIRGQVQATGHYGVCSAHNNFTDPVVIENQYCSKSDDLSKQILQSPSPWKGQSDVCVNAAIFVLFSRNMLNNSLQNSDGTVKNFEIYKCSNAKSATSSDFAARGSGCALQSGWIAKIFNHNHQNITLDFLVNAPASALGSLNAEGIQIAPSGSAQLDTNSWYKIVIRGGYGGVRGAATTTAGGESPEGILQVPIANARLNDGSNNWYYWYFKTGPSACPIDQVAVLPQAKFMPSIGLTQNYLADPYAANCNHLNPNSYTWKWDSLINPFVDRCPADNSNPDSGDYVAKICAIDDANKCASATEPNSPAVAAYGKDLGKTWITAAAVQDACSKNKAGAGELQIGYGGFKIIQHRDTDCLNTEIDIDFSQDAKSSSLNNNIQLYECPNDECSSIAGLAPNPIDFVYPQNLPGNPDPIFTNNAKITPKPTNLLSPDKTYRVVIKGTAAGAVSSIDSELIDLNFNSTGNNGGEACDPGVYPWRVGDPEFGLCAGNCKFDPARNLCGTKSQQCNAANSAITNAANYCSANCRNLGNANSASCGNGIVEPQEDCDDGNTNNGDGCSSNCLLEGTANQPGAVCGNGRIDRGEGCDDGNRTSGDGCSDKCLKENNPNTGSTPNVPICGNSKIEFGEDCDDGAGNGAGNRCGTNCLLSGSGGVCGNGKLESGKFDSYSWTFKISPQAKICQPLNFEFNPCPNGVWSIDNMDKSIDNVALQLYKGSRSDTGGCIKDSDMQTIGFWRRIWNQFVRVIKSFFGFHTVIAADWWCPINNESDTTFNARDLELMRRGGYDKKNVMIDGAATEIIGYTNEADNYKIDFIRQANWGKGTEYKAVLKFGKQGGTGIVKAGVTTYSQTCQIKSVRFDVWPRGAERRADGFFCASDPASGKIDECGRSTESAFDDDMSAAWTMNQPDNGYNLKTDGLGQTAVTADYKGGNQHLYRVWPLGDQPTGNENYVLRGTDFSATLDNLGTQTASADIAGTDYKGDFWMTSGFKPGRSIFNVTVRDDIDPAAGSQSGSLPIYTFFCNNPWPSAQNFPFLDSSANCKAGTGFCVNTNFATYYCRDAGSASTIDDDLPSIADYDAATKQFGAGTGVVTGSNEPCASLPVSFDIRAAYYFSADNKAYMWGKDGNVYKGSYQNGWEKIDKGQWQKNGLPANFSPVVGYSFKNVMYLWDSGGRYLSFDGTNWKTANKGDLPSNYRPTVGYVLRDALNTANSDIRIELWDATGNYKISTDGTSWSNGAKPSPNFKATVGYGHPNAENVQIWDKSGSYKVFFKAVGSWSDGSKAGLPSDFKPTAGFYDGQSVIIGQGAKFYRWINSPWKFVAFSDKTCDNKLKEFLFTGIKQGGTATIDAIGIRVYNNNNHYSPSYWYSSRFNPVNQGSLSKLIVDGNSAISEGRTTYVNAADYSDNHGAIFSNMYLISYSEGAGKTAQEIYNQLVANWFFNAGTESEGGLEYGSVLGYCSAGTETEDNKCYSDLDCSKRNAGHCQSDKGKLTRDIQRLADVQDIYNSLAGYYIKLRCSNDSSRACQTSAECSGGGVCGNFYPNLRSGSYITGKTYSVWPSWQDNLAKDLGAKLPVDPINQFRAWIGGQSVVCSDPYNPITCWDQTNKKMVTRTEGAGEVCAIDYNKSAVYAYFGTKTGTSSKIYIKGEETPTGEKWQPAWDLVANLKYNPFEGYNALITSGQFCSGVNDTCGNGVCDSGSGENCSNCPVDCGCGANQSCQKSGTNWNCGNIRDCGNGLRQPGEECDDNNSSSGDGCDSTCHLENGFKLSGDGHNVSPICGDGIIKGSEQCEFAKDAPLCGGKTVTSTVQGLLCCTDQCKLSAWFNEINKSSPCGDGIRMDQEECDCGSAGGVYAAGTARYNPFVCDRVNSAAPTKYSSDPTSVTDYTYCDTSCRRHDKGDYSYCGDGIKNGPEACDMGPNKGAGLGCNTDCVCASGYNCDGSVPVIDCNARENQTCALCKKCDAGSVCCDNNCQFINGPDPNHLPVQCDNGSAGCSAKPHSHLVGAACVCDSGYVEVGGVCTLCGNGILDVAAGEQCDNGGLGGPANGCTNTTCQYSCPNNGLPWQSQNLVLSDNVFTPTTQSRTFSATCMSAQKILARIGVQGSAGTAAVMFVVDLSGSMNNDNKLANLKNALRTAVDGLFDPVNGIPGIKIGIVWFGLNTTPSSGYLTNFPNCVNGLCDAAYKDNIDNAIAGLTAGGGTWMANGVSWAGWMLETAPTNLIANKSMVLMSDGAPEGGEDPDNNPQNNYNTDYISQLKNAGVKIYSAALTTESAVISAMNAWSSNAGGAACDTANGYCYSGTNIGNIYTSIINKLTQDIVNGIRVRVDGTITELPDVLPDLTQNFKYYDKELVISNNFCSNANHVIRVEFAGQGQVKIDPSPSLNFCPVPAVPHVSLSSAFSQVAGAYEQNSVLIFWQKILSILWQLLPRNAIASIVK